MTELRLGLNLNCLTNRWVLPRQWVPVVAELGLSAVQWNADLLDPLLPWRVQGPILRETVRLARAHGIDIASSFGGYNHHQNYLGHPDDACARWSEGFYRRLIQQAAELGARGTGTCFAILTVPDSADPQRRRHVLDRACEAWRRLAEYARSLGLDHLLFETTSVPRESCATFAETDAMLAALSDTAVPMRLVLDVGHRNHMTGTPDERVGLAWIRRYGAISPVIHLHQCNDEGSHHWPFTEEFNRRGDVRPAEVVAAVHTSGADSVLLAFELNHKAYHGPEERILPNLRDTVQHWRGHVAR